MILFVSFLEHLLQAYIFVGMNGAIILLIQAYILGGIDSSLQFFLAPYLSDGN